jgi:hypothetical protein
VDEAHEQPLGNEIGLRLDYGIEQCPVGSFGLGGARMP